MAAFRLDWAGSGAYGEHQGYASLFKVWFTTNYAGISPMFPQADHLSWTMTMCWLLKVFIALLSLSGPTRCQSRRRKGQRHDNQVLLNEAKSRCFNENVIHECCMFKTLNSCMGHSLVWKEKADSKSPVVQFYVMSSPPYYQDQVPELEGSCWSLPKIIQVIFASLRLRLQFTLSPSNAYNNYSNFWINCVD